MSMDYLGVISFLKEAGLTSHEFLKILALVLINFFVLLFMFMWIILLFRKPLWVFFSALLEAFKAAPKLQQDFSSLKTTFDTIREEFKASRELSEKRWEEVTRKFLKNDEVLKEQNEKILTMDTRLQALAPLPSREEIEILQAKIKQEIEQQKELK